jgi:para-nitrobenzyl esterase
MARGLWLGLAAALLAAAPALAEPVNVRIDGGTLTGVSQDGVESFKGIPYALPPVGPLRWRAPRSVAAWKGARPALDYGASCPQAQPPRNVAAGSPAEKTSEDCLTLNVWAPTPTGPMTGATGKAPVMVWIHGGGNVDGTGSQTYYDGSAFARQGVVLISINYRLGLLGFFAHPALTKEAGEEATGNFALMDQMAALSWARRNATAFGGDANNITVFGESAGGQDILALMAARPARRLFDQAIVQSGGLAWDVAPPLKDAEARGAETATKLGLPGADATAAQLRALPPEALVKFGQDAEPIADGRILTDSPAAIFARGQSADAPLIIGTNDNEGSVLTDPKPGELFPRLSAQDLAKARALYGPAAADDAAFARLLFRDGFFAAPARWIGRREAAGVPTYLYSFDYVLTALRGRRGGANHGSEIPFVFGTQAPAKMTPQDQAMSRIVQGYWISFAKTGQPGIAGAPPWPNVHFGDERRMEFTDPPVVREAPEAPVLDLLQEKLLPAAWAGTASPK